MVWWKVVLAILLLVGVHCRGEDEIPGCIDLESLPNNLAELGSEKLAKLKCLCTPSRKVDLEGRMGISVMCIYGSILTELKQTIRAVNNASRTIHRVIINHMNIDGDFDELGSMAELNHFEIRSCHGSPLNISAMSPANPPFGQLSEIIIEDCQLEEMPTSLLDNSPNLRTLNLRRNKITALKQADLREVAKSLEVLDLSGNLLEQFEPNSIGQLKRLQKLIIGEHNSVKDLAPEVGKLEALKILDLTRIDGLDDLSKVDFSRLGMLQNLILTGCNIRVINESHLAGLSNLRKLDLRVNLLEDIRKDSFKSLINLNYLSLAGNFLNESIFNKQLWEGLSNLQYLDIGWNEVTELKTGFFEAIGANIKALDLSHNEKLVKVADNVFENMTNLERMNLNGCGLRNVSNGIFKGLASLKELDLSSNSIGYIDAEAFNDQSEQLEQLSLDGNELKSLNMDLLAALSNLTELDLSANPWVCDRNGKFLANWIKYKYRSAAENNLGFLLKNGIVCDRPYRLRDRALLELEEDEFEDDWDAALDTTTVASTMTQEASTQETTLHFESLFIVVGNSSANDSIGKDDDDRARPKYDINTVKYGIEDRERPTNWVSIIAVGALLIATTVGVILVVRRRNQTKKEDGATNEKEMM